MKSLLLSFLSFLTLATAPAAETNEVIQCTKDLLFVVSHDKTPHRPFELTATVSFARDVGSTQTLVLEDNTGCIVAFAKPDHAPLRHISAGDVIRCAGHVESINYFWRQAIIRQASLIARKEPPPPLPADVSDLSSGKFDHRFVRLAGTVYDARISESNPSWMLLTIVGKSNSVYAPIQISSNNAVVCENLIGADITLDGICAPRELGTAGRRHIGRTVQAFDLAALRITRKPSESRDSLPNISTLTSASADEIPLFKRFQAFGKVLAVWERQAIIMTADAAIVRINFLKGRLPAFGQFIVATGFPETDLYNINLIQATWQESTNQLTTTSTSFPAQQALPPLPKVLQLHDWYHGRELNIVGTVLVPPTDAECGRLYLNTGNHVIPVYVDSHWPILSDLIAGCQVEISGTCILEAEQWHPNLVFPKFRGFILVTRTPSDLRIIARPPWWDTRKLLVLIGSLASLLVGFIIWNVVLRRVAARKGRELFKEQLGHVKADLRTEERTRLSVELHDTLAQNLTGVSLEIDTAAKVADENPMSMKAHLGIAAQALKSCRDELRNCLWDLRNRALETATMDAAIRQTLAPHVAGVNVAIRFNVLRERISDNTAHAILRIIRELTLNGIRHGGATKIWIAGSIEGGRMHFSVRDNGCGFNPNTAPGFSEGHYGLLGIQERVDEFEGEFTLTSSPGKGTRATVSINVPQET